MQAIVGSTQRQRLVTGIAFLALVAAFAVSGLVGYWVRGAAVVLVPRAAAHSTVVDQGRQELPPGIR